MKRSPLTRTRMTRNRRKPLGEFDADTKALGLIRSGGLCERCGLPVGDGWQAHHRRSRSAGGSRRPSTASVANLAVLDPSCHAWVEAHPAEAHRLGLMVRQSWEPTEVAMRVGGRFVLLTDSGTYEQLPMEA